MVGKNTLALTHNNQPAIEEPHPLKGTHLAPNPML
jgi:hypothetical protein